MILGVATHMAYCVAGLAVLITTTPWLFNALKYTGAVYLIWIGIQALRSRGMRALGPGSQRRAARRGEHSLRNFTAASFARPKPTPVLPHRVTRRC